jgi:hypothetical protein
MEAQKVKNNQEMSKNKAGGLILLDMKYVWTLDSWQTWQ